MPVNNCSKSQFNFKVVSYIHLAWGSLPGKLDTLDSYDTLHAVECFVGSCLCWVHEVLISSSSAGSPPSVKILTLPNSDMHIQTISKCVIWRSLVFHT